ncbi:ribonuclease H [Sesbania bispinosa]|nr:ribonuclease H [Sesbania bispinosa]
MNGVYTARSAYHWLVERDQPPLLDQHWRWIWKLEVPENIRCDNGQETILHCLWDCPESKKIWDYLGLRLSLNFYRSDDIKEWLEHNSHRSKGFFLAALWFIWWARNREVFNREDLGVREVVQKISTLTFTISRVFHRPITPSQKLRLVQ